MTSDARHSENIGIRMTSGKCLNDDLAQVVKGRSLLRFLRGKRGD